MQYLLLCSKYHTSDTVSYLLIIFEGYTSLMAWYASMNLCASPLLPLKNHWPFPHLHHPSAITTTCHCCRVLACWAGACKYLDERKNGCTRGRHVRKEAASVVSHLLSNYLKVTVWSFRNLAGNDWHLHKQRVVHLHLQSKYICHKDQLGYLSNGPINWC